MNREKAIEAMDLLASQGYTVSIKASPCPPGRVNAVVGEGINTDPSYLVSVGALSFDKVDLKHLCAQGDALGLDVGLSKIAASGKIYFSEPGSSPRARQHPR